MAAVIAHVRLRISFAVHHLARRRTDMKKRPSLKRKKPVYRFDLTKEIEEIREGAWTNARKLVFERITEIRRA
jgi:hypothetical protein